MKFAKEDVDKCVDKVLDNVSKQVEELWDNHFPNLENLPGANVLKEIFKVAVILEVSAKLNDELERMQENNDR